MKKKGFTLIELLIVIGIIAILAAIIFVAVDPARRQDEARNAVRWSSTNSILNAVLKYTVDNGGSLPTAISGASVATNYIIGTCGVGNCAATCSNGGGTISHSNDCLSLAALVDEYIASIPIDPSGGTTWTAAQTGYYLSKSTNGRITVGACGTETVGGAQPSISVSR